LTITNEPSPGDLGGNSPGRVVRRLLLATRPRFLGASVLPVLLGTAWGWHAAGVLDAVAFTLALAAVIGVHAGANVLNDVHDEVDDSGNEARIYPYTGGSRFIQNGIMGAQAMARWATVLLAFGFGCGVALAALKGVAVIGFGLAGLALGVFYSAPPVQLSARGLGVPAVGVAFGLLPVTGAAWLQSAPLGSGIFMLSIAVTLWIAAVLLINQVPDIRADSAVVRRTLAVRLGAAGTGRLYRWLQAAAVAAVMAASATGQLPGWAGILPLALLVPAWKAGTVIIENPDGREAMKKAIETTLGIHAAGVIWLMAILAV